MPNTSVSEIVHKDFSSDAHMGRGLRQGCPIAPLVYAAWTSRLLGILNDKIRSAWTDTTMTIFADDKFLCWKIQGEQDLAQAMREIAVVLQTLEDMGMKVSHSKSEAVLSLKGTEAERMKKRYIQKRDGISKLRIGLAGDTVRIPLKDEIKYLGVVLSCGNYELQSAKHRCKLAQVAYVRLRKVFRPGAVISKAARLRIYRACVWPAVAYGVLGLGLDLRALRHICSTVAGHLRKIQRL